MGISQVTRSVRCAQVVSFTAGLLFSASPSITHAFSLVIPLGYENKVGESAQFVPHNGRTLNVYNSSHFLKIIPEGATIHQIAFRMEESDREPLSSVEKSLEIRMAITSARSPDIQIDFMKN